VLRKQAKVASDARDDPTLLTAWRDGDAHAGNELLRRHFVAVYRFFTANLSQAGRDVDPEDLTQRTFEACITRRDAVQTDFRAYVFGVARRMLYLEWKRRKGSGDVISPSAAEIRDVRTSPSVAVARLDEQKLFLHALAQLPAEFRAVLERFYWEERPIAEIADELGIALGTVKSRLFRGKAMLRDQLMQSKAPSALLQSAVMRLEERTKDIEDPGDTPV
jgi:RNA polymerase sigma-70 factor (ECF subfamily)